MNGENVRNKAPARSSRVFRPESTPKNRNALRSRPNVLKFQEKAKARSGLRRKNGHIWGRNQVDQWRTGRFVTGGVTSPPVPGFEALKAGVRSACEKIHGVCINQSSVRPSLG